MGKWYFCVAALKVSSSIQTKGVKIFPVSNYKFCRIFQKNFFFVSNLNANFSENKSQVQNFFSSFSNLNFGYFLQNFRTTFHRMFQTWNVTWDNWSIITVSLHLAHISFKNISGLKCHQIDGVGYLYWFFIPNIHCVDFHRRNSIYISMTNVLHLEYITRSQKSISTKKIKFHISLGHMMSTKMLLKAFLVWNIFSLIIWICEFSLRILKVFDSVYRIWNLVFIKRLSTLFTQNFQSGK